MKFGAHVSIAKGLPLAPGRSAEMGGEVFQIFSRSPRGGNPPAITSEVAAEFKAACKEHNQSACYIHTPYFINFASSKPRIRQGSISVVREELERGTQLGVDAVMTHLGSAKDFGREKSVDKVIDAVGKVLKGYAGTTTFLLEQAAGAGGPDGIMGGTLEELGAIMKGVRKIDRKYDKHLGICVDTCHAWAMGYDFSSKKGIDEYLQQFDKLIGLKRLHLFHLNDSKFDLGQHKDRHEHLGKGKIGKKGFQALVKHSKLSKVNFIIETPTPEGMKTDLKFLKKTRS